eukprot:6491712-Amphidinium_carterae.2
MGTGKDRRGQQEERGVQKGVLTRKRRRGDTVTEEEKTERTRRTRSSISSSFRTEDRTTDEVTVQPSEQDKHGATSETGITRETYETSTFTTIDDRRRGKANFRNDGVPRDGSYYEKKIFEELRQRSHITQHPTSQYSKSTDEIKKCMTALRNMTTWRRRRKGDNKYNKEEKK